MTVFWSYDGVYGLKKISGFVLVLLLLAFICTAFISGQEAYASENEGGFTAGGFKYEISDEEKHQVVLKGFDENGTGDEEYRTNVEIPAKVVVDEVEYTVKAIADAAFAMSDIETVIVSEGINKIGDSAFSGCSKLKRIELPSTLTGLGNAVFSYCSALDDVVINDDSESFIYIKGLLSSIDRDVLYWASDYINHSLTLPEKTVRIMPYAFEGNSVLKKIVLNDGLTTIGAGAFFDCPLLERADISATVSKIEGNPFMYCTSLKKIKVASGNTVYSSTKTGLLLNHKKTVLISASAADSELTVPSKVKTIGRGAAAGNTKLTGIIFDEKLKTVNEYAFADCTGLSKVSFSNRKAVLAENGQIFKNAQYFMEVSIPYSEKAGTDGSIEAMVRNNSPKGVIITSR